MAIVPALISSPSIAYVPLSHCLHIDFPYLLPLPPLSLCLYSPSGAMLEMAVDGHLEVANRYDAAPGGAKDRGRCS